jgi:hypothetical protein
MPYISDAKRERGRWMTFEAAIAFVSRMDGCDRDCAEQQLRNALSDRKLFTKWEDQKTAAMRRHRQPTGHGSSEAGPTPIPDWPPNDPPFWHQTPIREGMVFDPFTQRERRLLLLRSHVQRIWPEQPPTPPPPEGPRPGAPSYRDKIEEKLSGVDLTNITNAIRLVRARWTDNDGKCPHHKTIRKWIRELRDKTEKT